MVYWNRFISYIYRYHSGRKCENVGFAKVSKNGRMGKLTIGLKNGMNSEEEQYGVYVYRETLPDGGMHTGSAEESGMVVPIPVSVGSMRLKGGRGEESFSFEWENVASSGRPITAFSGVAVRRLMEAPQPSHGYYGEDMFCSSWTDSEVDYSRMWERRDSPAEQKPDDRAMESEAAASAGQMTAYEPVQALQEDVEDETEGLLLQDRPMPDGGTESAVETMLESYERLPLLPMSDEASPVHGVVESVKITPNDIGLLDMCNWKLGVNSFLTHGFYSYKYLMLGKVAFAPEDKCAGYILGVPGVYSSREKYLAGIFGFDRFIPEKETQIKTGCFGYWIVDIR